MSIPTESDVVGLFRILFGNDPLGTVEANRKLGRLDVNVFMSRGEYSGPMPQRYRGFPVHYEFGSDFREYPGPSS